MYCISMYIHQLGTGVIRGILGISCISIIMFMTQYTYAAYIYCMLLYVYNSTSFLIDPFSVPGSLAVVFPSFQ